MPKSDATKSVWCAFENYVVFVIYVYLSLCVLTACVLANKGVH